jgi:hypothetical protein
MTSRPSAEQAHPLEAVANTERRPVSDVICGATAENIEGQRCNPGYSRAGSLRPS